MIKSEYGHGDMGDDIIGMDYTLIPGVQSLDEIREGLVAWAGGAKGVESDWKIWIGQFEINGGEGSYGSTQGVTGNNQGSSLM